MWWVEVCRASEASQVRLFQVQDGRREGEGPAGLHPRLPPPRPQVLHLPMHHLLHLPHLPAPPACPSSAPPAPSACLLPLLLLPGDQLGFQEPADHGGAAERELRHWQGGAGGRVVEVGGVVLPGWRR